MGTICVAPVNATGGERVARVVRRVRWQPPAVAARCNGGAALVDIIQDVFLTDPASQPRALDVAQIHVILPGDAAHQRRRADVPALAISGSSGAGGARVAGCEGAAGAGGAGEPLAERVRLPRLPWEPRRALAIDDGHHRVDRHRLIFFHQNR